MKPRLQLRVHDPAPEPADRHPQQHDRVRLVDVVALDAQRRESEDRGACDKGGQELHVALAHPPADQRHAIGAPNAGAPPPRHLLHPAIVARGPLMSRHAVADIPTRGARARETNALGGGRALSVLLLVGTACWSAVMIATRLGDLSAPFSARALDALLVGVPVG